MPHMSLNFVHSISRKKVRELPFAEWIAQKKNSKYSVTYHNMQFSILFWYSELIL